MSFAMDDRCLWPLMSTFMSRIFFFCSSSREQMHKKTFLFFLLIRIWMKLLSWRFNSQIRGTSVKHARFSSFGKICVKISKLIMHENRSSSFKYWALIRFQTNAYLIEYKSSMLREIQASFKRKNTNIDEGNAVEQTIIRKPNSMGRKGGCHQYCAIFEFHLFWMIHIEFLRQFLLGKVTFRLRTMFI